MQYLSFRSPILLIFMALFAGSPLASAEALRAFPTAEGFGAYAEGGRGGAVLHVTNLNDSGPGSLRWAVEEEGPRTIVFEVSGTIELESQLTIRNPYITIAGQTAPGDGICLKNGTLGIATHDVIVRYLRSRLGANAHGGDAISIGRGHDIIVDHCSASWSTDEALSASTHHPDLTHVTVQWCFITEALNAEGHGFGSLIRGTGGAQYSFLHNLYAHNHGRNPRPGNYNSNPHDEDPEGLLLDFRNNVIYNWGGRHAGYNADSVSVTRLNYVGNYLLAGADTRRPGIAYRTGSPFNRSYFADNVFNREIPENPWDVVGFADNWTDDEIVAYKQDQPFPTGPVQTEDAQAAFQRVLREGGASLPQRDAVDARIVRDVREESGQIIDHPDEVGGWPQLESAPAPADEDRDGMPDAWEVENGLDPKDPDDRNDIGEGGYTQLEIYLNGIGAGESSSKPVYLFTSFRGNGKDGLRFLYSFDGYEWTNVPGTFLKPDVGPSKLMRDPSIVRGPDDSFHLVWTTGWRTDQGFGYARSEDLVHWPEQRFIPVMEHEPTTVNVWAPELYYDENEQQFIICWASTIPGRFPDHLETSDNNHRMYYTTTRDFETFAPTELFFDPGFSVIDGTIVKREDDYVLVHKDNSRPTRNLRVAFADAPLGPWTGVSEAFTEKFTEGPTTLKVGEEWLIYFDMYEADRYGAVKTRDFQTFTNITDKVSFPKGHKHGTVITITQEELDRLLR